MAWSAPRTWVAGEIVSAALMNTHVRDNEKALSDPWGAYTVDWTSSGTAPAIGNGTKTGVTLQVGKWTRFRIFLDWGTTTSAGTGTYAFSLPVAAAVARGSVGTAVCYDGSILYPRLAFCNTSSTLVVADMVPNRISGTVPFTWSSTSELHIIGEYEAA